MWRTWSGRRPSSFPRRCRDRRRNRACWTGRISIFWSRTGLLACLSDYHWTGQEACPTWSVVLANAEKWQVDRRQKPIVCPTVEYSQIDAMEKLEEISVRRKAAHARLVALKSKVYAGFLAMEKAAYADRS